MFGINFTELMVIGVVALIVLGPERLPKLAKTVGVLLGRAQRYVHDIKRDIHQEIELTELKKLKTDVEESARSLQSTLENSANSIQSLVETSAQEVKTPLDQVKADLQRLQQESDASLVQLAQPPASPEEHRPVSTEESQPIRPLEPPMPIMTSDSDAFESAPETAVSTVIDEQKPKPY